MDNLLSKGCALIGVSLVTIVVGLGFLSMFDRFDSFQASAITVDPSVVQDTGVVQGPRTVDENVCGTDPINSSPNPSQYCRDTFNDDRLTCRQRQCVVANDFTVTGLGLTPAAQEFGEGTKDGVDTNRSLLTQGIVGDLFATAGCIMWPETIGLDYQCASTFNSSRSTQASSGLYGQLISLTATMYEAKPADTSTYIASVLQEARVVPAAYAQGIGFSALSPVLGVWTVSRNIAYLLFVLIFLVIGFMIMFRQKIGSQTVITAQQAIPSIIVALLAVTFSYAIAGLMIDVMYLVMYAVAGVFGQVELISGNIFQVSGRLISEGVGVAGGLALGELIENALGGGLIATAFSILTSLTAQVIILLVIVFNAFRLFFKILTVYIELILSIAFAPFILLTGAIPGRNPFGKWIQGLIANLAVFPFILVILIFFEIFTSSVSGEQGGLLLPYMGGSGFAAQIVFLAALGLVIGLPQGVDEIRKALGAGDGGMFGNILRGGAKNFGSAADLAIPGLGATGYGVAGAARSGYYIKNNRERYRNEDGSMNYLMMANHLWKGAGPNEVGGVRKQGARGWLGGQEVRRFIDNTRDGRLFDANNIYRILERRQQGRS